MKEGSLRERLFQIPHVFRRLRMQRIFPDISHQEFVAMEIIYREEKKKGDAITVSGLAKKMRFSPPTASRLLRCAERKGLIARSIKDEDRRNTHLYLTEYGKKRHCEILMLMEELMDTVIVRMGEERVEAIIAYVQEFVDIMEDEISKREGAQK